jgi:hypothetical protein
VREVLVGRLGRADAALLRASLGPGGLRRLGGARAQSAALGRDDLPAPGVGDVLRRLAGEAGGKGKLTLVLPPSQASSVRLEVEDSSGGRVTEDRLAALSRAAAERAGERGKAVLACRLIELRLDGQLTEEPVGRSAATLTARYTAITASLGALKAFEDVATVAGLTLEGVVSAPEAAGTALLPGGERVAVLTGHEGTLLVSMRGASVEASAFVPVGRRHLVSDLVLAYEMDEDAARERLARVLSGRADPDAERIVRPRLEELGDLLTGAAGKHKIELDGAVVSGLARGALPSVTGAKEAEETDPLLTGAAHLALGSRGHHDAAALFAAPRKRGVLSWLRRRF